MNKYHYNQENKFCLLLSLFFMLNVIDYVENDLM